ncbi:MAG: prenyltransferase/squalene oxidase repeat-containing protein [Flavisolibacter sp.]
MKKTVIILLLAAIIVSFNTITTSWKEVSLEEIKVAINKTITIMQPSDRMFLENAGTCHSCHHQDLSAITIFKAKEKGYPVNDTIFNETIESILATLKSRKATNVENDDPVAIVMSGAYSIWALAENKYPSNKTIDLQVKNLMQRQTKNGSWVSPNPRPPLEYYAITATALVIRAMKEYAPLALGEQAIERTTKARNWLMKVVPETNEEKAFQLLGLTWANADSKIISQQAKKLIATQQKDGGWSQLETLETDAYATGQSLHALYESGQLKSSDAVYQKGITFLLNNQKSDGSWRIKSRSFAVVPFVETGFPVAGDQFISAAGSNWAMLALLHASK